MATIRKAAKPAAKTAPAKSVRAPEPQEVRLAAAQPVAEVLLPTPDRAAEVLKERALEAQEFSRKITQGFMNQTRDSYDQFKKVSEEATASAQKSFDTADANLKALRMRVIDFAQQQAQTGFDLARSLAGAASPADAMQLWTSYLTRQPEAAAALQKDIAELTRKLAADSALPMGGAINLDPFGLARRAI